MAISREDFFVETRDRVKLRARVCWRSDVADPSTMATVVLVHGIAAPLEPTYDLPVPGYSFLEELARRGLRAVAFDHRGFGKSDRDPRMNGEPRPDPEGKGLHGLDDSVEDIRAVVEATRAKWKLPRLTLFGSSRGAIQVLASALAMPDALELAILNNPSSLCYLSGSTEGQTLEWMKEERDGAKRETDFVLYTAEYQRKRWKKLFGDHAPANVDDALQEAYIASCIASDEEGAKRSPQVFRVPSEGFPVRVPLLPLPTLRVPTVVVEAEEVPDEHVAAFFATVPKGKARMLRITDSNHFTLRNARRFELANIIESSMFGVRASGARSGS